MPLKSYSNLFKEIKSSNFLKTQVLVLFIITYIDWTLIPFITKLEGTYLPVFMISFFMLIGALDGFVQPLFKNVKIYNIYLFAILLDIVQIFSYFYFSISILTFTYIILTIFTVQGITFEIARVHTVDFMQDEKVELKDYLMIRSFIISFAIITGSLSSMFYDYFTKELSYLLIFLTFIGVIGIYLQYILYKKFKKRVNNDLVIIQKIKKNYLKNLESNL